MKILKGFWKYFVKISRKFKFIIKFSWKLVRKFKANIGKVFTNLKKLMNFWCSHLANTIAIQHIVVDAEYRFCLDPALVLAGCCGQDFADYNLCLPLRQYNFRHFCERITGRPRFSSLLLQLHPVHPALSELPFFLRHIAVSRINYRAVWIFVRDLCSSPFLRGRSRVCSGSSVSSVRMIWATQFASIISSPQAIFLQTFPLLIPVPVEVQVNFQYDFCNIIF